MSTSETPNHQEFSNLYSSYEKGFISDLLAARYYYYAYLMVSLNAESLNKHATDIQKDQVLFIQTSSQNLAVLHLSKLFEKRDTKSNINLCLDRLLEEVRQENDLIDQEIEVLEDTTFLRSFISGNKRDMEIKTIRDLVYLLNKIINQKSVEDMTEKIRSVRNTSIAHNDLIQPHPDELADFWPHFESLLLIGMHTLNLLGKYVYRNQTIPPLDKKYFFEPLLDSQFAWLRDVVSQSIKDEELHTPIEHQYEAWSSKLQ